MRVKGAGEGRGLREGVWMLPGTLGARWDARGCPESSFVRTRKQEE